MTTYEGAEVQFDVLLNSETDVLGQPHTFAAVPQVKELSKSNWIGGWVYSGADSDVLVKINISSPEEIPTSIVQHLVSRHIDWVLLGRIIGSRRKLQDGEVRFAPGISRIQKKSVHDYTVELDGQSIINLFMLIRFSFYKLRINTNISRLVFLE
jgi:hypothetical protein